MPETQETQATQKCGNCGGEMVTVRYRRQDENGINTGGVILDTICPDCLPEAYHEAILWKLLTPPARVTCYADGCHEEAEWGCYLCAACVERIEAQRRKKRFLAHCNTATAFLGVLAFCIVGAWIIHAWLFP